VPDNLPASERGALIAIDWGTSNCRAFRLGADGAVAERRAGPGILQVPAGGFPAALAALVGDWMAADSAAPVLMAGMIGSRQGWHEAPYVEVPAGGAELAAGLAVVPGTEGRVRIVPGLAAAAFAGGRDVIRGEETQIVGAAAEAGDGLYCLPGTHSKWAEIRGGAIRRFATFMTGEVYGALRHHTILGRLMTGDAPDDASFARGLAQGEEAGGLLHQLFTARTHGLFDLVPAAGLSSFLSGLLIGHETRAALALFPGTRGVVLIGAAALAAPYTQALEGAGLTVRAIAGEDAAARGLAAVARLAGLR